MKQIKWLSLLLCLSIVIGCDKSNQASDRTTDTVLVSGPKKTLEPLPTLTPRTPVPSPTLVPTPTATPLPADADLFQAVLAMPSSPVKIISYFNQNSQWWDYATAVELSKKLKSVGCSLRSQEGMNIAKRIQVDADCDIALVISYGLEFKDFSAESVTKINEQCIAAKKGGLNPSDVIFHYEANVANATQCNALFQAVKTVWPAAVINWYDYPGWSMATSGSGTKEAVPLGTKSDAVSYNLYMTGTNVASMTILYNTRTSDWVFPFVLNARYGTLTANPNSTYLPAMPWLSIMGTYGDVPQHDQQYLSSQWSWRRNQARERIEMYNMGRIVQSKTIRYPFRGIVAFPGSFDHRYDMYVWVANLTDFIRGLRGDVFVL